MPHRQPTIAELYHRKLSAGFNADPCQQAVVAHLEQLRQALHQPSHRPPQGIYLWGPVGRGKTFLMDMLCESLPPEWVLRLHFHRFMALIHNRLSFHAGHPDPLSRVAQELASRHRLLCFDEFLVAEIGDAMLLGRLIEHLFKRGVALVSTSNRPPHELYQGDIHRDRFEPTVQRLQQQMAVVSLHGDRDHRMRSLNMSPAYFVNDVTPLQQQFSRHAQATQINTIRICNRDIYCRALSDSAVWFDFGALCDGPRSHLDYIEIARLYPTVLLSDVPLMGGAPQEQIKARGTEDSATGSGTTGERRVQVGRSDNHARRFIALVDELYDRQVNLFIHAHAPLESLYQGSLLQFDFERTRSRLIEMSTQEYQCTAHRP